jgi:hypothetical protein
MKNTLLLLTIVANFMLIPSCQSQNKPNPVALGTGNGDFDLDQITFKEDANTLFSKVKFIKLPRMNKYYDKVKKENVLVDTPAFEYKVANEDKGKVNTYFLDRSLKQDLVFFFTDKSSRLKAFSMLMFQKQDFASRIEQIRKKYGNYEVKLKPNPIDEVTGRKVYQWETPEKIIAVALLPKDSSGDYSCGLVVVDLKTNFIKFPINQFIFGSYVCVDQSCK